MSKLANPFVTSGLLEIGEPFVGRYDEFYQLVFHMTGAQATSVNLIGDKHLGKSCLLYRFTKIWGNLVPEDDKYVVVYLSFADDRDTNEKRFYQHIAEELCAQVDKHSQLYAAMKVKHWN